MVLAELWGAVGGLGSVLAATEALVTIVYARATVLEGRVTRRESHEAHQQDLVESRAATDAAAAAHREETADRAKAFSAEVTLERIRQVERVCEVLTALIAAAREETINPPPQYNPPMPFRATAIPALLVRLGVAVAVSDSLGGPQLLAAGQLANYGYQPETTMKVVGMGIDALREIDALVRNHEALRIQSL